MLPNVFSFSFDLEPRQIKLIHYRCPRSQVGMEKEFPDECFDLLGRMESKGIKPSVMLATDEYRASDWNSYVMKFGKNTTNRAKKGAYN